MTKIHITNQDGDQTTIDAEDGLSLMEAAMNEGIPDILAECGGACACATCHVYVHADDFGRVGEPSEIEEAMLEFNDYRQDTSRLSCQIKISPELEGLRVTTPESQL